MTEQELQSIEARAAQATPGPWECCGSPDYLSVFAGGSDILRELDYDGGFVFRADADAAFIAAAREDVPKLCTDLRRFRAFARRLVACYDGESSDLFALVREVRAALGEGE